MINYQSTLSQKPNWTKILNNITFFRIQWFVSSEEVEPEKRMQFLTGYQDVQKSFMTLLFSTPTQPINRFTIY